MKLLLLLCTFGMAVYLNTPFLPTDDGYIEEIEGVSLCCETIENNVVNDGQIYFDLIENAIKEAQFKMSEIEKIKDKEKWFIAYKEIINEYTGIIDPPLTVYDYYTDEEIYLIQRAVETECYDQSFEAKANVASVIFNRIDIGGEFGDTVKEVITKENQFAYGRKVITESTILAIEYAFQIEDTTNGCIAFRSGELPKEWLKWVLVFEDDAGHGFYKFKEE